jgi:opacity protein-like surface antigen
MLRAMKYFCGAVLAVTACTASPGFAGFGNTTGETGTLNPDRFEVAAESAYLLGAFGNPNSYEIGAEFLEARIRWGVVQAEGWTRGYNQFTLTAMAEPIFRGVENHYFGVNFGARYNFVQPGSRFVPYVSGGLGLGGIDSRPSVPGAQGQDFTFNILAAAGLSYKLDDRWKINAGALYQHLSNGGQTDPNPSLNLFGPQIGISCSF